MKPAIGLISHCASIVSACFILAQLGCAPDGGPTSEAASEIFIDPMSSCSADLINSALSSGATVHILEGTCALEGPILVPSGGRIHGAGKGLTELVPTWAPQGGADDPNNSVIRVVGEVSAAPVATTTLSLPKDSSSISLSNPVSLDDNQWLLVRASNGSDDEYRMSDGNDVFLSEMVHPRSAGPSAGFDLGFNTMQHHRSGASVYKVTPVTDVDMEGFDIKADGGAFATGIQVSAAFNIEIRDVSGAGLSRSLVELGPASRQLRLHDIYSRGENNSIVLASSAMDIVIDGVDSAPDGARVHPLGVPRALLTFRNRVTTAIVSNAVLQHGATGIRTWGGHHLHFSSVVVRDMDTAPLTRDLDIAGGISGACVDGGAGPLHIAEFGVDSTFNDVHLEDCRQPIPPSYFNPVSWYLHDQFDAMLTGCTIVNKGLSPNSRTMGGLMGSDTKGIIDSLSIIGVNYAFQTQATTSLEVGFLRIDGAPGTGSLGIVAIYFNHGLSSGPHIDKLEISKMGGHFRFGPDFTANPDWDLRINELTSDNGKPTRTERNLVLAKNGNNILTSADFLYRGDVVTLQMNGAQRIAKTPTGPSTSNATVVSGAPGDYGYGFMMVTSLPSSLSYVTADSGAVCMGDLLVAGPNKRAVVNNAPSNPFHVLGKAMSAKAAGAEGLVQVDIP